MSFLVDKVAYKGLTFDHIMLMPYYTAISSCYFEPFSWFKLTMEWYSLVTMKAFNARKCEFIVNQFCIQLKNAMNRPIKNSLLIKFNA